MSPENSERLKAEFPELFTRLNYGFDVSDTWFGIVHDLCHAFRLTLQATQAQHPEKGFQFSVTRVKQKFGELRVYWRVNGDVHKIMEPKLAPLVEAASSAAKRRCEFCDSEAVGRFSNGGFVVTACLRHGEGEPLAPTG